MELSLVLILTFFFVVFLRFQKKSFDDERRKDIEQRRGKLDPMHFELVCKKCSATLVSAEDMVTFNHHHIVSNYEEKYHGTMRTVPIPPEDQHDFATERFTSESGAMPRLI